MGFSLDVSVPAFTVFLQGLVSFFSPCVLPLIPLYIGYLSGGTGVKGEDGRIHYKRSKVMTNTLFFVLGVSFAFFLLGFGVSALGAFFKGNQALFARIGAIIIILFGLYQLGIFGSSEALGRERRLSLPLEKLGMSPVTALLMGFTFSFAWTPCVGPALASVLLMSASASTKAAGFLLIGVYTLGFVLPFLAVGFFTTSLLELFKKHGNVVKYTVKIGAVLMIAMGLLMFTGKMNAITGYLSDISQPFAGEETDGEKEPKAAKQAEETGKEAQAEAEKEEAQAKAEKNEAKQDEEGQNGEAAAENQAGADEIKLYPAIDFTLTDQYGNSHTLSDYKGKTVFINFWATWCPPCRAELPDIQKLYEEYQAAGDESVVILGVAAPDYGNEKSDEGIIDFLETNGITYPVVMDKGGDVFGQYGINSFPTTLMVDKDGNMFGYVSGQLSEDIMRSIISQTIEGRRG